MKPYTLTTNRQSKQVAAKSYLEALMDEAIFLKSCGKNKFTIEASNKDQKLGIYVRA
jgi:hypothetical protein